MEPFKLAGKYIGALMSDLPRKNGWTIAEHVGDASPDRTQRLLNHAVWDHDALCRMLDADHAVRAPAVQTASIPPADRVK